MAGAAVTGVPYANTINSSARRNGLDPWLLAALLWVESRFNPKARSATGDVGIAQINLASHPGVSQAEAENPAFAIPWAARYLATLKRSAGGSASGALRAYNTGSSAPSPAGDHYANVVLEARTRLRRAFDKFAGYLMPVPGGRVTQLDQGIDYQGPVGGPVVAIGAARIDAIKSDPGGFGQVIYYTLLSGPARGQQIYTGEAQPTVRAGQKVKRGQRIATLVDRLPGANVTGPGVTEIGLARNGSPVYSNGNSGGHAFTKFLHGAQPVPAGFSVPFAVPGLGGVTIPIPIPSPSQAFHDLKAPFDAVKASGELALRILRDPGYVFLWVGFALVGLAFVFLGVERLLGRSGRADAGRLATVVAAPETAAVGVGA